MKLSQTKNAIRLAAEVLLITSGCLAQNIPRTIWGKWIVKRELPTGTISCWRRGRREENHRDSDRVVPTKSSVGKASPRVILIAEERTVTADQFHDENSSPSSSGSQVSFHRLGIPRQASNRNINSGRARQDNWGNDRNPRRQRACERLEHDRIFSLQYLF